MAFAALGQSGVPYLQADDAHLPSHDIEGSTRLVYGKLIARRWERLLLATIAWCCRWLPTMGGAWSRLISGLTAPRERRRRPDDRPIFIRRGWPATAMGGLSGIEG